jgi:hypothetical protein
MPGEWLYDVPQQSAPRDMLIADTASLNGDQGRGEVWRELGEHHYAVQTHAGAEGGTEHASCPGDLQLGGATVTIILKDASPRDGLRPICQPVQLIVGLKRLSHDLDCALMT